MSQNSRMHWDPAVSMASATALLFTKGQQADLSSRGRKEAQGVTTPWDVWRVHVSPYFAAAWTCVCGSKDSKRQSCCPIYKPGANLTAFYFFWCCRQRELMQIMFQVTIQHWAWGRVLKSCPPPPCQTAECFINLKQPPPTRHPGCIQVLSCPLGKGRNISVRSEKDQDNTLHSALMTFATFCKARLQTCFLIASGSNPDWQRIIQQLSFLWNTVITL